MYYSPNADVINQKLKPEIDPVTAEVCQFDSPVKIAFEMHQTIIAMTRISLNYDVKGVNANIYFTSTEMLPRKLYSSLSLESEKSFK